MATSPLDVKLRVGFKVFALVGWKQDLPAALDESNAKVRIEGLPDTLNPEIMDREKAEAFLTALPKLPAKARKAISGKTLYLNNPDLMLGVTAPTRAAAFNGEFTLAIAQVQGDLVMARSMVAVDCGLARDRAREAREKVRASEDETKQMEAKLPSVSGSPDKEKELLTALSNAKSRRFALALVWRENSQAWAACPDAPKTAKSDLKAAQEAAKTYAVPGPSGMQ